MASQEHLDLLKQGVEAWNQWRKEHADIQPDLSDADLSRARLCYIKNIIGVMNSPYIKANLSGANLSGANLNHATLSRADLRRATLNRANLSGADLSEANFGRANLWGADLSGADLWGTYLGGADLSRADLSDANLSGANLSAANLSDANLGAANLSDANLGAANLGAANLSRATLVRTNFAEATLSNCHIYGIAAWGVELRGARQNNLVITPEEEPTITVDNLKIAQFIYLLLNNAEIREVIDTITSKVVLILGRFTPERKAILDALRNELRKRNYSPVLFDFAGSENRDVTETISLLARMARFVLADITDARSIPQELSVIVPDLPSVPIQPLLLASASEYGMFEHFSRYPWVLPTFRYQDTAELLASLQAHIIASAEQKARELTQLS